MATSTGRTRQKTGRNSARAHHFLKNLKPPRLGTGALNGSVSFLALSLPANAQDTVSQALLQPQSITGFAILTGLVVFSTTLAVRYIRERSRWGERQGQLTSEIENLRSNQERILALAAADGQAIVSWVGRSESANIESDSGFLAGMGLASPMAFGSWAPPVSAKKLEDLVDRLKECGEAFQITIASKAGGFVDAEGRAVAGRAVLRLRDVTGERAARMAHEKRSQQLEAECEAHRALLATLTQPVWTRQDSGELAWVNQAYATAVDADSPDDVITRQLELLDADDRQRAAKSRQMKQAFSQRAMVVMAGDRKTVDIVEAPTAWGSAGIVSDRSELEAVRTDLERQMAAHVRTLDRLPTAVAVFDSGRRLVYRNAAYEKLWSLEVSFLDSSPTNGEILDLLRTERRLPELGDFKIWKSTHLAGYASTETIEDWWYLPDGRTIHMVANPNPQGGMTYLFDDATERFTLESRVNSLSRVQRETLDSLREGVAVFGTDGRLRLSNPAFALAWKLTPEVLGATPHIDEIVVLCRLLFPHEEVWTEVRSAISGVRDAREDYICRMERRDGTIFDCAVMPLPDGASLLTFADATASVNVERALTDRNEALEKASQLREDFVHHVSYELRSPLTNIIGFAQLLGEETFGSLNEKQRDYISHILRSSGALLAIVNDILDLASVDNGELSLDLDSIDIREIIDQAVLGLADRLAEADVRLVISIAPEIGQIHADGRRLRQVVFNLLSNAIGFSAAGQSVHVLAMRHGDEVRLTVADEGRGIPPEVKAKVFDRFESHALGSRHRGVGLGLSIVRSLVELHGGRVELESAPGQGTRVTCTLPVKGGAISVAAE
jgi:signal transduction histidine kinase